jgi:hypothetical protein
VVSGGGWAGEIRLLTPPTQEQKINNWFSPETTVKNCNNKNKTGKQTRITTKIRQAVEQEHRRGG